MFNTQPIADLVIVRFLRNDMPYAKGECAGFSRARAEMLAAQGFAEIVGAPKPTGGRIPEPEGSGIMTPPSVIAPAAQ